MNSTLNVLKPYFCKKITSWVITETLYGVSLWFGISLTSITSLGEMIDVTKRCGGDMFTLYTQCATVPFLIISE